MNEKEFSIMKMNKKGFTLIEMLVVIAIIAVLVAIVVPTVSSSTNKAKAATDAANLRSAKAVIQIAILDGTMKVDGTAVKKGTQGVTAADCGIPATSKSGCGNFNVAASNGTITVKYGNATIENLAAVADGSSTSLPDAPAPVE